MDLILGQFLYGSKYDIGLALTWADGHTQFRVGLIVGLRVGLMVGLRQVDNGFLEMLLLGLEMRGDLGCLAFQSGGRKKSRLSRGLHFFGGLGGAGAFAIFEETRVKKKVGKKSKKNTQLPPGFRRIYFTRSYGAVTATRVPDISPVSSDNSVSLVLPGINSDGKLI